jgi:hypothetical protein
VAVVVGYYPPALTQGITGSFICDRTLYVSQGPADGATTLSSVITTPNFALNTVGVATRQYNAIGFNIQDGFIYGIAPNSGNPDSGNGVNPPSLYRINTGTATPLGSPAGFPVILEPGAGGTRNVLPVILIAMESTTSISPRLVPRPTRLHLPMNPTFLRSI